jgi:hypothetical protein
MKHNSGTINSAMPPLNVSNSLALSTLQTTVISAFLANRHVSLSQQIRTVSPRLELVYSDIGGPITPTSLGNAGYFLTFTDDFTRYCWIYSIPDKSSKTVLDIFKRCNPLSKTKAKNTSDTMLYIYKHKASPMDLILPTIQRCSGMIKQNAYGYDPPYASPI